MCIMTANRCEQSWLYTDVQVRILYKSGYLSRILLSKRLDLSLVVVFLSGIHVKFLIPLLTLNFTTVS